MSTDQFFVGVVAIGSVEVYNVVFLVGPVPSVNVAGGVKGAAIGIFLEVMASDKAIRERSKA
ncbi:hypothetical protein TYRP_017180 [Tyrophagus putrescentiae]|nr:hypothetical protein TYRP_017180 [Tyrophagus putrescentiae]